MNLNRADEDDALRERILMRSQAINIDLVTRLTTVADDLAAGQHLAALGGISFLLLLQQE